VNMPADQLVCEASAIVAWKLYQNEDQKTDAENNMWINRKSRRDRIAYYRWYHNIPDYITEEVILQAISEDWGLE
jgi:hypothetical protein